MCAQLRRPTCRQTSQGKVTCQHTSKDKKKNDKYYLEVPDFSQGTAEVVASLAYRDKNPISETLTSVQEYYDHWIFGDPNCGKMQTQFSKLPRTE